MPGGCRARRAWTSCRCCSAALTRLGVDHRLVIVGDGPMRAEVAAACPDAVCPGMLGRERLAQAYASADLFVFPSRTDTAGNVVLEAQASGLPVLVSEDGGPRELMRPGITGIVCPPELHGWMMAAASLLANEATRRTMGAAAREYALSCGWDLTLAPLYAAYREASGAAAASSGPAEFGGPRRVA